MLCRLVFATSEFKGRQGAIDRSRGKSARDLLRAPRVCDSVRLAVIESKEMRDGFGNVVPARECSKSLDFLAIGATCVLRCKTCQPQTKRRRYICGMEVDSENVTRTPCCIRVHGMFGNG